MAVCLKYYYFSSCCFSYSYGYYCNYCIATATTITTATTAASTQTTCTVIITSTRNHSSYNYLYLLQEHCLLRLQQHQAQLRLSPRVDSSPSNLASLLEPLAGTTRMLARPQNGMSIGTPGSFCSKNSQTSKLVRPPGRA